MNCTDNRNAFFGGVTGFCVSSFALISRGGKFDAAELDRILFNHNNPTGDVNQDGTVDSNDYAMLKEYVLCQTDLLDKSNLTGEYDAIKDNYENRVIITQKYYCADYDHDKSVDGIDLFYLDNRINNLI
ncbi:MAG: hypothetical protein K5761_03505 [Clostridiales bacterium]|nr:hypothetical protein [Clostridiales bacterium]